MDPYKQWVIDRLTDWRETFEDEALNEDEEDENEAGWKEIGILIDKFLVNKCTKKDYENILFHLYQKYYDIDDEIAENIKETKKCPECGERTLITYNETSIFPEITKCKNCGYGG